MHKGCAASEPKSKLMIYQVN